MLLAPTNAVVNERNAKEHSVLKMRPIDRFGLDLSRVRFLPPSEVNDELFYVEEDRKVLADNTFSLKATRFELRCPDPPRSPPP